MTTTLTERYIAATIRSLSPASEADVRAELDALIADAIEARVDDGEERADAERTVLTELGDPDILAAGYSDRPLNLIGPRYYLTWRRLLKLLLIIVPATAVGGVILAQALANASIGETIGQAVVVGLSVVVHVAFWVTLVFAVLERTGADTGIRWSVDQLPEPQTKGTGRADMIAALIFLALAVGALLWDRFIGFVRPDGTPLPILAPELWPWSIIGMFLLIAAEATLAILIYRAGRWTISFAVLNTAFAVLFASLTVTLLGRGQLFNPEFISYAFTDNGVNADTLHTLAVITGFSFFGFAVWDAIDGWIKMARATRR